jgi:hypothetical protein
MPSGNGRIQTTQIVADPDGKNKTPSRGSGFSGELRKQNNRNHL